ncbi:MAG: hypothetical protein ACRCZ3_06640 [Providencia rustigianii]|uniref:hypothetical protein n=1 Tax=Providencia rustigianii TaxID=158850 RepID=UPI003F407F83
MTAMLHKYKRIIFTFTFLFFSFQSVANNIKKNEVSIFTIIILEYMKVTMEEHNQPLSKEKMEKFHFESALAYATYLKNWLELNKGQEVRTESISFHEAVIINENGFKASGLPYDAWFFADIYSVFNESERDEFWKDIISNPERKSAEKIFVDLWFKMKTEAESSSIKKREKSQRWLSRMRKIPLVIEMEKTMAMVEESFIYKK